MNKKLFIILLLLVPFLNLRELSCMDVYLGIQAKGRRIDLGLARFVSEKNLPEEREAASKIREIVLNDLIFSLYFNVQESDQPFMLGNEINFKPWRDMNSDVLAVAFVELKSGFVDLKLKAYDVESGQVIWTKNFYATMNEHRKLAHMISNEVVFRLTGQKGIAESKIVFSNDSSGNKEIYTADYDGYNVKRLTHNKSISIFPRWSPNAEHICFTSYHHGNPDLFIISSDGVVIKPLSARQGLNTSARWSPDGESLALTLSIGRSPDIYLISNEGKILRNLTSGWGAEVSPSFSPDGNWIVFTSDKPGFPQIYTLDLNTGTEKRLFSGRYADSPVWSPNGDRIVFSMIGDQRRFDIFSIDVSGRNLVQLTKNAGRNENPSWSADGRFILFVSDRYGKNELFMMAADGSMQRKVMNINGECFTPDWSR